MKSRQFLYDLHIWFLRNSRYFVDLSRFSCFCEVKPAFRWSYFLHKTVIFSKLSNKRVFWTSKELFGSSFSRLRFSLPTREFWRQTHLPFFTFLLSKNTCHFFLVKLYEHFNEADPTNRRRRKKVAAKLSLKPLRNPCAHKESFIISKQQKRYCLCEERGRFRTSVILPNISPVSRIEGCYLREGALLAICLR